VIRISDDLRKEIIRRVLQGESRHSVAQALGINVKTVNRHTVDLVPRTKPLSPEIREQAILRVAQGEAKQSVAAALGVSRYLVQRWTSHLGLRNPNYHAVEVREELLRRVRNGEQKVTVAKELGVSHATAVQWTKEIHIRRRYSDKEREVAIRRVEQGEAKSKVALELGFSESMVRSWTKHVNRSNQPIPDELRSQYKERVRQGESVAIVARELGINVTSTMHWARSDSDDVTPDKEQQILLAIRDGKTIAVVAQQLAVPKAIVRKLWRIEKGKPAKIRRYSDEEKFNAIAAVEAGATYTEVAAQLGCYNGSVLYWHRAAVKAGTAKERPVSKTKGEDADFDWISRNYPHLEDWRELMVEWVAGEKSNFTGAIKALGHFIVRYLDQQGLPTTRAGLLKRGTLVPSFYETSCPQSEGGISMNNIVHRFLEWVLRSPDFSDDSEGDLIPSPAFRNPVPLISAAGMPRASQSVRSVLPYFYITELRERLASGPHFRDWTLAQSLLGKKMLVSTQAATDWFPISENLIDKTDPDCVWRIRDRLRLSPVLEMWSPVRWVAVLIKLQTTGRTGQIRMSDSGESDTYRFEHGKFVLNNGRLAAGTSRKPWQQGMFRRVPNHGAQDQAILYFNNNKTADKTRSGADIGQECPWPHLSDLTENPYYWLEKLRNWQEKYNPVDRRTRWNEIPVNRALGIKHEHDKAKYPETCFMFRTPEVKGEEYFPISPGAIENAWFALLYAFQRELDEKKITHPDGSALRLIDRETGRTDYPLHGLRVSLITHLIVDGEMPPEIMMKIVGHARLVMTLYYTKPGLKHMQDALMGAAQRIDAKKDSSIIHFLANSTAEEMRNRIVFNTEQWQSVLSANPEERNPVGWLLMHDGICLAGGNTGPLGGNTKVPGCHNGGTTLFEQRTEYNRVPGEIRNCARCRWKVSEKHHGPAIAASLNNKLYHLHKEQQSALRHATSLHDLKKQKAQDEATGTPFDRMKDLRCIERLHESAMTRLGNIASDVAALYRTLEHVKALPDSADGSTVLAAHGDVMTMQILLEETPSELLQLAGVCGDIEIYPDLSAGTAIFRRSQLLDAALEREGRPPFFMKLSEEDMLVFGNAFMKKIAAHSNPLNPLLGLRAVAQIIDSHGSLEQFLGIPLTEILPTSGQQQKVIPLTIKLGSRSGKTDKRASGRCITSTVEQRPSKPQSGESEGTS
jgi:transposase-like protein